ncbi:MAG: methyltransferase [Thermomicrobiales bacterium]|nr:MAG: methyltransferase [Thermomicrobiales bacterium]
MLPEPSFRTQLGAAFVGDSRQLLDEMESDSVDLVITSPPFPLLRQKAYGNEDQEEYVDWLLEFGRRIYRVLKPTGSFVLDLGGTYQRGVPIRSLYQYRVLLRFCDELGFYLAEEFFWHNPSKLPSPIEWVNKRKIRAKDTVNTIWWFAKTEWPYADVRQVLTEYSDRMRRLLADSARYYTPKERPSGHDISARFDNDNGGAIPSNLLVIPNTESNSRYLRRCKALGIPAHPARFPAKLPEFFIRLLTRPDDLVLDIFAGSNTTGEVAERLCRRWLAFEIEPQYVASSILRFVDDDDMAAKLYEQVLSGESCLVPTLSQPMLL